MPISQIVTNSIADSAVVTVDIANGAVTQAKLGTNVASNGPAFSAYKNAGNQTITASAFVKVTFDTELFDTNNNFASSTFTPTVAGYYQFSAGIKTEPSTTVSRVILMFYKNNSLNTVVQDFSYTAADFTVNKISGSQLISMNGTTDYLEVYAYVVATTAVIGASSTDTWFTGALVRAA
jgi:hypothetical protein